MMNALPFSINLSSRLVLASILLVACDSATTGDLSPDSGAPDGQGASIDSGLRDAPPDATGDASNGHEDGSVHDASPDAADDASNSLDAAADANHTTLGLTCSGSHPSFATDVQP